MIVDNLIGTGTVPSQKKSFKAKDIEWIVENIKGFNSISATEYNNMTSYYEQQDNVNLYNGIFDNKKVEKIFNPLSLKGTLPIDIENYPIEQPKFNTLIGEEIGRKYEWQLRVLDEDSISQKQKDLQEYVKKSILNIVINPDIKEEEVPNEVNKLQRYIKYDFKDLREVEGTRLLDFIYHRSDHRLDILFKEGFKDVLKVAREIYDIDIIAGEPQVTLCDPLSIRTIGNTSAHIEDNDVIIKDTYQSIGKVIDNYYSELTEEEIDELEEHRTKSGIYNSRKGSYSNNNSYSSPLFYDNAGNQFIDNRITVDGPDISGGKSYYDGQGNVRVINYRWKSLRKVGFFTFYDDNGDEQKTVVDEHFTFDKSQGGKIEWKWISEWWEATVIGDKIIVKYGPRKVQFRNINNISECKPGYIGTIYNKGISMMDRIKPFKYLYNIFMKRFLLAFAQYKAPILELDISKKPDNWDFDKWMYYGQMGYLIIDPFREIRKGVATGKLAGSMNTTGRVFNFDMGNYIQHHVNALQFIELKIADILGIPREREGALQRQETVGGLERSVIQWSHNTEEYFMLHDDTKNRVMLCLLDTAKVAWKNQDIKRLQYIDDGLNEIIYSFDIRDITETEFGLYISNDTENKMIKDRLLQLAQAGLQNDKMDFTMLMSIFKNKSISAITNDIEMMENDNHQRISDSQKAKDTQAKEMLQMQLEQQKHTEDRNDMIEDRRYKHELQLKEIDIMLEENKSKNTEKNIDVKVDIEKARLKLQEDIKLLEKEEKEYKMNIQKEMADKDRLSKEKIAKEKRKK